MSLPTTAKELAAWLKPYQHDFTLQLDNPYVEMFRHFEEFAPSLSEPARAHIQKMIAAFGPDVTAHNLFYLDKVNEVHEHQKQHDISGLVLTDSIINSVICEHHKWDGELLLIDRDFKTMLEERFKLLHFFRTASLNHDLYEFYPERKSISPFEDCELDAIATASTSALVYTKSLKTQDDGSKVEVEKDPPDSIHIQLFVGTFMNSDYRHFVAVA